MSSSKKLAIVILFIILLALPLGIYLVLQRQQLSSNAGKDTKLTFAPLTATKLVNETFSIDITIDTGSNIVDGAELHILYDPAKLSVVNFTLPQTPFLPIVTQPFNPAQNTGSAFIQLSANPGDPQKGIGTLATITFQTLASTNGAPTLIRFGETGISSVGENVLTNPTQTASVVISTTASNVTPIATASGKLTLTPTTRPIGSGSQVTPTSTTSALARLTLTPTLKSATLAGIPTATLVPFQKYPTGTFEPTVILSIVGIALTAIGAFSIFVL